MRPRCFTEYKRQANAEVHTHAVTYTDRDPHENTTMTEEATANTGLPGTCEL